MNMSDHSKVTGAEPSPPMLQESNFRRIHTLEPRDDAPKLRTSLEFSLTINPAKKSLEKHNSDPAQRQPHPRDSNLLDDTIEEKKANQTEQPRGHSMVGTKPENHNCDNYDAFSERLKMRASQPRMTFGNLPEAMNTNIEQGNVLKKPKQPSI